MPVTTVGLGGGRREAGSLNSGVCESREQRGCKSTRGAALRRSRGPRLTRHPANPYCGGGGAGAGARPGNALSSLALSLPTSSSDIVMPVSASYWATELRTISSKDRGALVFFALSSSLAAAFAPAASSVAAFFSAACGVQPARQHGERSAGAAMCKLTFFDAFSAAAFSLLNPPRSSDGSGVPSADNPNNACDAVGRESGRTRPAARRTLRRLSTRPRAGSRSEAACPRRSRREIVVRMSSPSATITQSGRCEKSADAL